MAIKTMRPNGPWCMWPGTALARDGVRYAVQMH